MTNLSVIEDMPNITANFADDVYEHDETPYEKIFLEVFTAVGLLSVTANILMIFVILKYKKMREDATNLIFLHINILQAIYLIFTPLTLRAAMAFFDITPLHAVAFCVFYQIEFTVMLTINLFLFLFVCDWYLKTYYKDTYVKFCRVYRFFVIALYVLVMFACSLTVQLCFKNFMLPIVYLVLFVCIALLILFLLIVNVIHAIRKRRVIINNRKGNIGLAISNICLLSWSPLIIFTVIINTLRFINAPVLMILLISLGFSSPVINLIYLYCCDDNYSVFLKQVFTCKCNEYKNENFEDQSVSYNDENGVHISEN